MNLARPPLLAPLREGTVRDKADALRRKGIGPNGWTPHWFRQAHASALLLAGTPEWVVSRRLGHAHVQTTLDLYGWVREDEALRAAANWKSYAVGLAGGSDETVNRPPFLASGRAGRSDLAALARVAARLAGTGHRARGSTTGRRSPRSKITASILTGLPDPMAAELAWMAHWQAQDGTRSSVLAINHLASIVRHGDREGASVPGLDP